MWDFMKEDFIIDETFILSLHRDLLSGIEKEHI